MGVASAQVAFHEILPLRRRESAATTVKHSWQALLEVHATREGQMPEGGENPRSDSAPGGREPSLGVHFDFPLKVSSPRIALHYLALIVAALQAKRPTDSVERLLLLHQSEPATHCPAFESL